MNLVTVLILVASIGFGVGGPIGSVCRRWRTHSSSMEVYFCPLLSDRGRIELETQFRREMQFYKDAFEDRTARKSPDTAVYVNLYGSEGDLQEGSDNDIEDSENTQGTDLSTDINDESELRKHKKGKRPQKKKPRKKPPKKSTKKNSKKSTKKNSKKRNLAKNKKGKFGGKKTKKKPTKGKGKNVKKKKGKKNKKKKQSWGSKFFGKVVGEGKKLYNNIDDINEKVQKVDKISDAFKHMFGYPTAGGAKETEQPVDEGSDEEEEEEDEDNDEDEESEEDDE